MSLHIQPYTATVLAIKWVFISVLDSATCTYYTLTEQFYGTLHLVIYRAVLLQLHLLLL